MEPGVCIVISAAKPRPSRNAENQIGRRQVSRRQIHSTGPKRNRAGEVEASGR